MTMKTNRGGELQTIFRVWLLSTVCECLSRRQFSQDQCTPGHCRCVWQRGRGTNGQRHRTSSCAWCPWFYKEGRSRLPLWDTGAQTGWEALGWRRTAWAGGQLTIHSALELFPYGIWPGTLSVRGPHLWNCFKGKSLLWTGTWSNIPPICN